MAKALKKLSQIKIKGIKSPKSFGSVKGIKPTKKSFVGSTRVKLSTGKNK